VRNAPDGASGAAAPRSALLRWVPRNQKALTGYYVAIASLIPMLGLVLGPAAVVYGIEGLRDAARMPNADGRAHSWTAIIIGGAMTLLNCCGLCLVPTLVVRM
jgi:hypothetical protein